MLPNYLESWAGSCVWPLPSPAPFHPQMNRMWWYDSIQGVIFLREFLDIPMLEYSSHENRVTIYFVLSCINIPEPEKCLAKRRWSIRIYQGNKKCLFFVMSSCPLSMSPTLSICPVGIHVCSLDHWVSDEVTEMEEMLGMKPWAPRSSTSASILTILYFF